MKKLCMYLRWLFSIVYTVVTSGAFVLFTVLCIVELTFSAYYLDKAKTTRELIMVAINSIMTSAVVSFFAVIIISLLKDFLERKKKIT